MNQILIKPIITERSLNDAAAGKFTFAVDKTANKPQIAQAVITQFAVHVVSVRTSIVKGKTKRAGKKRLIVKTPDWKKATVALKTGEKIDLFEVGGATNA
ncbi:MAG: 50S ribosomal protein L23 [Patescibacteria group bacterium]